MSTNGTKKSAYVQYVGMYNYRFHMDPSGTLIQYDAKAIGSGSEGAQQNLQETYHKVITLQFLCHQRTLFEFLSFTSL